MDNLQDTEGLPQITAEQIDAKSYIIHGADDYLADLKWRGGSFKAEGSLDRATFRIKYRHVKTPRTLTLYAGSSSSHTRDENAHYAEQWMVLRDFVMKTGARLEPSLSTRTTSLLRICSQQSNHV